METQNEALAPLVDTVAKFTALVSRRLPDDVSARIKELSDEETAPMARMIWALLAHGRTYEPGYVSTRPVRGQPVPQGH